jgi:uncharacterized protein YjgD (DUF1641 family)
MSETDEDLETEGEAIQDAAAALVELQQDGTLEDLTEAATAVSLLADALDDEMVSEAAGLANDLGLVAGSAAQPDTIRTLQTLMDAMDAAEPFEDPERVGAIGAARKLRDEDVQRGLGFLFTFLGALGQQIERRADAYDRIED